MRIDLSALDSGSRFLNLTCSAEVSRDAPGCIFHSVSSFKVCQFDSKKHRVARPQDKNVVGDKTKH